VELFYSFEIVARVPAEEHGMGWKPRERTGHARLYKGANLTIHFHSDIAQTDARDSAGASVELCGGSIGPCGNADKLRKSFNFFIPEHDD
jgi:hypothetical protein